MGYNTLMKVTGTTLWFLLVWSPHARANGQTTHLWISEKAIEHLEQPALVQLLEEQKNALRLGSMFPDGGYPIGHEYGEAAHWEPFQDAYRDWIRVTYPDLADPEAAQHIAFYLGLASHGMADQVFDSMYMERSRIYDAEYGWFDQHTSLDTAQDIVFAALTTAQEVPDVWIPDHFPALFSTVGVDVDMDTMMQGQDRLELAVLSVGGFSEVDQTVDVNIGEFPWACSHLLDESVPGSPPFEAKVVARYWQHLWSELHGEEGMLEVIGSFPTEHTKGHAQHANDIEAKLSLVFSRGLHRETVTEDYFRVEAAQRDQPIDVDLFYGDHSHVVNVSPKQDWLADHVHTLWVADTFTASDGRGLTSAFSLPFSTEPVADTGESPADPDLSPSPSANECGCSTSSQTPINGWLIVSLLGAFIRRKR